MVERVETGGMISFDYSGKGERKLSDNEKKEIKDAYRKYHERRKKEKTRRTIFWIILVIILLGAGIIFFKYF